MITTRRYALVALFCMLTPASGLIGSADAAPPPPDVIFHNANIHTLDPARPRAGAIAVAGGRIVAVGGRADVIALRQAATRMVDLEGATVLPGLIDAHGHVASLGSYALGRLDLSQASSFDEVVEMVAAAARNAEPGTWILGGRWDHESWPSRTLPTHAQLSAATPDNPVYLTRVDGHAALANAAAMKLAGVDRDTGAPAGGEILKDAAGEPTGVFVDTAKGLILRQIGDEGPSFADLVLKAQETCLAVGLTGVHDMGISPAEIDEYRRLADTGKLKLRVYALVDGTHAIDYFAKHNPLIGDRLTVRAAKLYADGAMGSRGAWLLKPYADRPVDNAGRPYTGLNLMKPEFLRMVAEDGLRKGYQVCTHAIGDAGNRITLDAYAIALSRRPTKNHRYRIEHAQLLEAKDIPRFAALGVLPSMQPTHCISDMRWVYDRVGAERAKGAYAWASLRKTGVPIPGGSDFPIESPNPLLGIYAAVTRQNLQGEPAGGWHPEQRMTRDEALRSFTIDAAYAAFEEKDKGTLVPGKLADFVAFDRDVMTCEVAEIPKARVLRTVIGGETVYLAPPTP